MSIIREAARESVIPQLVIAGLFIVSEPEGLSRSGVIGNKKSCVEGKI